jgi:hypothetical protein
MLPVRSEQNPALKQHAPLTRAVEDHGVVAAIQTGPTQSWPPERHRRVAAIVENCGRTRDTIIGRDEPVAGQVAVLILDRDRNRGRVEQANVHVKASAVRGEQFGQLGVGVRGFIREHIRGGVVHRGAQVSFTRTDSVPSLEEDVRIVVEL